MKRLIACLLCVALLLPTVAAAKSQPTAAEAAQALHSLGLFQGTVAGRFDEASMALSRPATRVEALVIFLRLLGKEDAVHVGQWPHSFTDVAEWATPYVGYAWKNGLTTGLSKDKFGSAQTITLNQYLTFVLRAFGYSEAAGDFSWVTASMTAEDIGLCDAAFTDRCRKMMTRGDVALLSYAALSLPLKDKTQTLAGALVAQSAVSADALAAFDIPLDTAVPAVPVAQELTTVHTLTNAIRAQTTTQDGIARKPLVLDAKLNALAQIRAEEVAVEYSHTRPDGRSFGSVFRDNGVEFTTCYENIVGGYKTAERVVEVWNNSPGHLANMLKPNTTRMGVGRVGDYWVQLFAN